MKTILFATVFLLFTKPESKVYFCDSPNATKYHFIKNCRGLNACKHEVKEISLIEAQNNDLTICGWED